jgi:hypothetical protein
MRLHLTPEQSACWVAGGQAAWRIEEEYLAMAEAQGITEPVVVCLADGRTAFAFRLEDER